MSSVLYNNAENIKNTEKNPLMSRYVQTFDWYGSL